MAATTKATTNERIPDDAGPLDPDLRCLDPLLELGMGLVLAIMYW